MYVCTMHIVRLLLLLLLLDPTLTLPNLTPLLERVSWDRVEWELGIPRATVSTILSSGGDDSQCRRRCCEVYLSDHPAPSWKQVAEALYRPIFDGQECPEELEVVQKKYMRGESAVGIVTCVIIALLLVSSNNYNLQLICMLFYFMITIHVAACYV